jgi:hypothetical protein
MISSSELDVDDPSTSPQPTASQIQIDPSTLSQVLAGAIHLAQSGTSPLITTSKKMPCNKPKATAAKPRNSKRKNSKSDSAKKTSTKKKSNQKKLTQNEEKEQVTEKTTQHWDRDDNGQGKTSIYFLLNWITDEDNFSRFKSNGSYKRDVAEEVERYLVENGITWRNAGAIQRKVG